MSKSTLMKRDEAERLVRAGKMSQENFDAQFAAPDAPGLANIRNYIGNKVIGAVSGVTSDASNSARSGVAGALRGAGNMVDPNVTAAPIQGPPKPAQVAYKPDMDTLPPVVQEQRQEAAFIQPAYDVSTQTSRTTQGFANPGDVRAKAGVYGEAQAALKEKQMQLEVREQDDLLKIQDEQVALQRQEAERQEKAVLEQQKIEKESFIRAEAKIKSVRDVDPQKYWKDKSAGATIMAGIGILLGAHAQSLSAAGGVNTTNLGMDAINAGIERDAQAQLANQAKDKQASALGQALESDKRAAGRQGMLDYNVAKSNSLAAAINTLETAKGKTKNETVKTRIELVRGSLAVDLAKTELDIATEAKQSTTTQTSMTPRKQQELQEQFPHGLTSKEARELNVPGLGYGRTVTAAQEMRDIHLATTTANTGIRQMLELADSGSNLSANDRAKAKSIQGILTGKLIKTLVGAGAVSEGERALMLELIANPMTLFSLNSSNRVKLETLLESLNSNMDVAASTRIIDYKSSPVVTPRPKKPQ